jgi:hypothetical protein
LVFWPLTLEPATRQSSGEPVIYLDQGWSQDDREWYYQVSQGSAVISYDIFLNLEVAGGQELFRSDVNSDRYGMITQPANPRFNPDGLPIGLSKTMVTKALMKDEQAGEYVGLTCAACHNAQLNYQGKRIRIDGGVGNTFDMMGYIQALDDALQATLKDPAKFDRLATRLKASGGNARATLRKRFESDAARVDEYRTRTLVAPVVWGHPAWIHPLVPELPFGGVGNSGMGKYHGRWGFEAFTNARGVMYHSARIDPGVRYPPYSQHNFERRIESKMMP